MNILAIETSCDETAICILQAEGGFNKPQLKILGQALLSQVDIHREYGGVYPSLAKREHAKNLIPLLRVALQEADMLAPATSSSIAKEKASEVRALLEREPELFVQLAGFVTSAQKPKLDAIAVTNGPGLEPALWVGINCAKALSLLWDIPIIPINHMEGHVLSSLMEQDGSFHTPTFPLLALLVSGGHTEFILANDWHQYQYLGRTRDDAVGEAFDKVARMMDLPYPGGPEISKLAKEAREENLSQDFSLPRPMLESDDLDFSFSGLKTAVLYTIKNLGSLSHTQKRQLAREFEEAVVEVLVEKSVRAIEKHGAKQFVLGGGVSANQHLRLYLKERIAEQFPDVIVRIPPISLTTDNAIMIAIAGYFRSLEKNRQKAGDIVAAGNLSLA